MAMQPWSADYWKDLRHHVCWPLTLLFCKGKTMTSTVQWNKSLRDWSVVIEDLFPPLTTLSCCDRRDIWRCGVMLHGVKYIAGIIHTILMWFWPTLHMSFRINTLRPRQNGRHLADDVFQCTFLYENVWISLKVSLKFVPEVPINNIPALVQIMAWCRSGDKPLSESMMVSLMTHTCVTRPQWVKSLALTVAILRLPNASEANLNTQIHWILLNKRRR